MPVRYVIRTLPVLFCLNFRLFLPNVTVEFSNLSKVMLAAAKDTFHSTLLNTLCIMSII
jgi:hypothetical protein